MSDAAWAKAKLRWLLLRFAAEHERTAQRLRAWLR